MADDTLVEIERRPITAAARILAGGPVALVTSSDRGRMNVAPVVWHTPLSSTPALVGIALERSRHSAEMISHAEEFALNFPARALLHHVQYLGAMSGSRIDKIEATQWETFEAIEVDAPLLTGCIAWVECKVQQVVPVGDHLLFVGVVVSVQVLPHAFDERWLLKDADVRPLHFLGERYYSVLEGVMEARAPGNSDAPERVLADRLVEELELSHDAQERRAELLGELAHDVALGNVIDVSQVGMGPGPLWVPPPGLALPHVSEGERER